jgi:hypothetical protein
MCVSRVFASRVYLCPVYLRLVCICVSRVFVSRVYLNLARVRVFASRVYLRLTCTCVPRVSVSRTCAFVCVSHRYVYLRHVYLRLAPLCPCVSSAHAMASYCPSVSSPAIPTKETKSSTPCRYRACLFLGRGGDGSGLTWGPDS